MLMSSLKQSPSPSIKYSCAIRLSLMNFWTVVILPNWIIMTDVPAPSSPNIARHRQKGRRKKEEGRKQPDNEKRKVRREP